MTNLSTEPAAVRPIGSNPAYYWIILLSHINKEYRYGAINFFVNRFVCTFISTVIIPIRPVNIGLWQKGHTILSGQQVEEISLLLCNSILSLNSHIDVLNHHVSGLSN